MIIGSFHFGDAQGSWSFACSMHCRMSLRHRMGFSSPSATYFSRENRRVRWVSHMFLAHCGLHGTGM